ncbi:MAG: hypothetical protein MHPSP_003407, partial [Paramarteilia canceri]
YTTVESNASLVEQVRNMKVLEMAKLCRNIYNTYISFNDFEKWTNLMLRFREDCLADKRTIPD